MGKYRFLNRIGGRNGRHGSRLIAALCCAAAVLMNPFPALAEDGYAVRLGISVQTDSSVPVSPREVVPYNLSVSNLAGRAWLRVRLETSSSGVDVPFQVTDLDGCDGWIRKGEYLYLTYLAPKASVIQAVKSFRVPDIRVSENGTITVKAYAEGIDSRSVKPDFNLDDPWKGQTPSTVVSHTALGGSATGIGAYEGAGSGGSGSGSSGGVSSGGLVKYKAPQGSGTASSGSWYLVDADNRLWKFGSEASGKYAEDGWYYLANSYSQTAEKNQWFYFDKSGYMYVGWMRNENEEWYHLHDISDGGLGSLDKGAYVDSQDGRTYCLDQTDGRMKTGWQKIGEKDYYFAQLSDVPGPNWIFKTIGNTAAGRWFYNTFGLRVYGSMFSNEYTPDGHFVNTAGEKVQ